MQKVLLVVISILLFSGCKKEGASDEHLPAKLMQKVMMDVNLAETYCTHVQDNVHHGSMKNTDSLSAYYKTIFSHYKITQEQFYNSMEWYKQHPEELDSVYARMIPVAVAMQPKTLQPTQLPKADSLAVKKVDSVLNRAANIPLLSKTDTIKSRPAGLKNAITDTIKNKKKMKPKKQTTSTAGKK